MVSPLTVIGLAPPVAVMPPGFDVTRYDVIALPPLEAGGVKLTVAWALPGVAVPMTGAPGNPAGVTEPDAADAGPVPIALIACTVKV